MCVGMTVAACEQLLYRKRNYSFCKEDMQMGGNF